MTVSTLPAENRVRLLSLDVFRGITVALMIIVNCPGNAESYAFLNHSPWNGCSLADLVFPFFLFMVGVSTVFALSASKGRLTSAQLLYRVFKRSIILFLCGLFLNVFPNHFAWETLRISGVLQRIAVCYLVAALLEISTSVRLQIFIGSVILIAYWLFMCYFPVPGFGAGNLSPQANLAAYVDRLLIPAAHLYQPLYDPEGVLSTLPAIGTTLLGCITAHILLAAKEESRLKSLFFLALILSLIGWGWGFIFPINKSLWSSSFVLWTGGLAIFAFSLCYWLIDILKKQNWCRAFKFFGANALALYMFHIIGLKLQVLIHFEREGQSLNAKNYLTQSMFGSFSPPLGSLLYAVSYMLFCGLCLAVYQETRGKIHQKISLPA